MASSRNYSSFWLLTLLCAYHLACADDAASDDYDDIDVVIAPQSTSGAEIGAEDASLTVGGVDGGETDGVAPGTVDCAYFQEGTPCGPGKICVAAQCRFAKCGDGWTTKPEACDDGNRAANDGCSPSCGFEFCGDGVKQAFEGCDDGNHKWGDGCSPQCRVESQCGNGVVQGNEECDDGNTWSGDGCNADCRLEDCGDGSVQSGEECDDGNRDDGDGCSAMCRLEQLQCGDGEIQGSEECDDGNILDGDGCSAECELETPCGDGILQFGEQCDDGNNVSNDGCSSTCRAEVCGDLIVQTKEQCDDGNRIDGDGCSRSCRLENCGDGVLDIYEECDDGNLQDGDGCSSACRNEDTCPDDSGRALDNLSPVATEALYEDFETYCGSCHVAVKLGFQVTSKDEMPAKLGSRHARLMQTLQSDEPTEYMPPSGDFAGPWSERGAGDPIVIFASQFQAWFDQDMPLDEFDWPVDGDDDGGGDDDGDDDGDDGGDEGGDDGGDDCPSSCGDGVVDADEECDDGNTVPGDGCSANCLREAICGDGIVEGAEECDDANLENGDGCDAQCFKEDGRCGDGRVDENEECDDGNTVAADGCSVDCRLECGDGIVQGDEQCDDGNRESGDGCTAHCRDPAQVTCVEIEAKSIPVRTSVVNQNTQTDDRHFVAELYDLFSSNCSGCHPANATNGLAIQGSGTFAVDTAGKESLILDLIRSSAEGVGRMPPGPPAGVSLPWSERDPSDFSDPLVKLSSQLEAWFDQGKPTVAFTWAPSSAPRSATAESSAFVPSEGLNARLTNLGSCAPSVGLFNRGSVRARQKDALFAGIKRSTAFPKKLSDTDLYTFDSADLAEDGVLSFAPSYALWADGTAKARHFKLPDGQNIAFDSETQEFRVPGNTRFYKTFSVPVTDMQGRKRYRKMETRLILVRRDSVGTGGSTEVNALFGSYRWNDAETEAHLVTDTLRNGQPFRDTVFLVETDELLAQRIKDENSPRMVEDLLEQKAARHYAIPGSVRCVQCHLGSPTEDFVLGFTPVQLLRRPSGTGGTYDPTSPAELEQLQRLIQLDIFDGLDAPSQVLPLEAMQGDRRPRNNHELTAQGYMLGNCAHCHNPRGFPSIQSPELVEVLDMYPSEMGGMFQYPLDSFSPRIFRGPEGDIPIPYISPSLYDLVAGAGQEGETRTMSDLNDDYLAPWRSLIYRNVDTPYTYASDFAIFPHMPLHTPGHDCRARNILGDWMVSIPSRLINPELPEDEATAFENLRPQSWEEVFPGESDYAQAVGVASERMSLYHERSRYNECDEGEKDIVNAAVRSGNADFPFRERSEIRDVPSGPHYTTFDPTDVPGPWTPRGATWEAVLASHDLGCAQSDCSDRPELQQQYDLLQVFEDFPVDAELEALALEPVPQGLWKVDADCDFSSVPKRGDLDGLVDDWPWLRSVSNRDAPIYMASPGAMVFAGVCAGCHGRSGDSAGRNADSVLQLTGGRSRVANFRSGLFGPEGQPGLNIESMFADVKDHLGSPVSADDWAARYVVWMTLGGTLATIPTQVLEIINRGRWAGAARKGAESVKDGNMLVIAREICNDLLPGFDDNSGERTKPRTLEYNLAGRAFPDWSSASSQAAVVHQNGDVETWRKLCNFRNLGPVRVARAKALGDTWDESNTRLFVDSRTLFHREDFPPGSLVVDEVGRVRPMSDDIRAPWCVKPVLPANPDAPTDKELESMANAEQTLDKFRLIDGQRAPYCPKSIFALDAREGNFDADDMRRWSLRGAANTGAAVYLFLREMFAGRSELPPEYNECSSLGRRSTR